jgi:GT2 family glycosyltransferase/glycosyltransferase involved in cell wall biosynthesis
MTVDVIVPVHRGFDSVRRCIDSVLAFPQSTPFELVVVDDASPEPELAAWLRDRADRGHLTLLQQPSHAGHAAAVNRASALHRDRDCLLLHGDVEVANDWLDRLADHASRAGDIGTVAPFASSGGVAGYPRSGVVNALPSGYTVASLDALFQRANGGAFVAVPFTRGPCIYLRRECIAAVGAFDAAPLGSDYGVELDFSLRASSAGFRHLLAGDVLVAHAGAESFGESEARDLAGRSEKALEKLYPHYSNLRDTFSKDDPARPFQRRVDLARLAESPKHLLLFVSHAWGGGIRRHMTELAALIGERCNVLFLEPVAGNTVKLSWPQDGEAFAAYFSLPDDLPALVSLLRAAGLARIHFHHVHGLPRAVLDLPTAAGVPYDCTLHDYYAICPQYHLVTEDGRYCGEPDAAGCAACLARRPHRWDLDIGAWRSAFGRLLRDADRVIAPSRDMARRIARYYPDVDVTMLAHPESPLQATRRVTRVVTLGNLTPEKGLHVVEACAREAAARDLPLSFRVLGSTTEAVTLWPEAPLSIQGQYREGELASLLATERPDVIWFPAQVPESYSYTLSVAMAAGVPIVASALGAFPERLASYASARLVPWDARPEAWNEALIAAAQASRVDIVRPLPSRLKVS